MRRLARLSISEVGSSETDASDGDLLQAPDRPLEASTGILHFPLASHWNYYARVDENARQMCVTSSNTRRDIAFKIGFLCLIGIARDRVYLDKSIGERRNVSDLYAITDSCESDELRAIELFQCPGSGDELPQPPHGPPLVGTRW